MAKQLTNVPTYPTTDMAGAVAASFTSDLTWKRIDTLSIYLKGNIADTEEPRKSLAEWYKTNDANIASNGLRTILSVSSWAIVVDITWKLAFNNVRNINSTDDTKTPQNPLTDANYQAVGAIGDTVAIKIGTKGSNYNQPVIRIAQTITTKGIASGTVQVNELKATSYYTTGVNVKSYTDNTLNTPAKIIWGSESSCDTKYWSSVTACNGVAAPWGFGTITNFSAGVKGKVRAWHFLADEKSDVTKNWSIVKGNHLEVLYYEFVDRTVGATAADTAYQNTDEVRWSVTQTSVSAADESVVVSVAAFVAGILSCLF